MNESIRDVAARMRRLHDSGVAYDSLAIRVADWVLAVTEPGGDVPSVEEALRLTESAGMWDEDEARRNEDLYYFANGVVTLHARLADERAAKVAALEADDVAERDLSELMECCKGIRAQLADERAKNAALKAEVERLRERNVMNMDLGEATRANERADPASHDLSDADLDLLP